MGPSATVSLLCTAPQVPGEDEATVGKWASWGQRGLDLRQRDHRPHSCRGGREPRRASRTPSRIDSLPAWPSPGPAFSEARKKAAPGAQRLLWDHLQRVPAGKQRCFVREGYRLNPQQFPQAPSSWLICQTGCFPDRVRMLNSQTSVIFFLFWSDQKNGGGG